LPAPRIEAPWQDVFRLFSKGDSLAISLLKFALNRPFKFYFLLILIRRRDQSAQHESPHDVRWADNPSSKVCACRKAMGWRFA
jgi:hypothetical protein